MNRFVWQTKYLKVYYISDNQGFHGVAVVANFLPQWFSKTNFILCGTRSDWDYSQQPSSADDSVEAALFIMHYERNVAHGRKVSCKSIVRTVPRRTRAVCARRPAAARQFVGPSADGQIEAYRHAGIYI